MSRRALSRRAARLVALGLVGAGALAAPGAVSQDAAERPPAADRAAVLDAAAAWRDVLESHRAPAWPRPGDSESAIVLLRAPAVGGVAAAERDAALDEVEAEQREVASVLGDLGATVTLRTQVAANAVAIRLPAGGLEAVGRLPQVRAIVPVGYLAPAQADGASPTAPAADPPAPARPAAGPARIALIDAGVDVTHPALGGGIGPTFPIVGGVDMVDRDADPRIDAAGVHVEAHGTQMAGIVLGSGALADLPAERRPRLVVHRVVAGEAVGGRTRPLARTDRVLGALERSVDPNGDGDPADRAEVILVGLASGFSGGGVDPLAEALAAADRLGSTVVVPAGNDGPTFTRPGAVGTLASAPTALTVGGVSREPVARTVRLSALLGPAEAELESLPLLGADPAGEPMPVVVLRDDGALLSGDLPEHHRDEAGDSRVRDALVVVARGGGTLPEKARVAASEGARAVAIWDEAGPATYPVTAGHLDAPIPIVGLGRVQGEGLERLLERSPDVAVTLEGLAAPAGDGDEPAGFSSWGPTAAGRQKPDLLAPAVAVPAPLPGRGPDGAPRSGTLTGTSAAAADVAARAARLRIERPALDPAAVRALLVQGARPLERVATARQGGGVVDGPADGPVHIAPAVVHAPAAGGRTRVSLSVVDLSGAAGRYRVSLVDGDAERPLGTVTVAAGGTAPLRAAVPAPGPGARVVVRRDGDGDDDEVVAAPVVPLRPAGAGEDALGEPRVRVAEGFAEVMVRVGELRREDGRVVNARLHSVRVQLVPADGGEAIRVLGARQDGDWPAGTYRLLVSRRAADGVDVPDGLYRVRVTASAPDGSVLRRQSARFPLR